MGGRLFTDKLVFGWLEVLGVWSLDSATPSPSAYPAHASGSPWLFIRSALLHESIHLLQNGKGSSADREREAYNYQIAYLKRLLEKAKGSRATELQKLIDGLTGVLNGIKD